MSVQCPLRCVVQCRAIYRDRSRAIIFRPRRIIAPHLDALTHSRRGSIWAEFTTADCARCNVAISFRWSFFLICSRRPEIRDEFGVRPQRFGCNLGGCNLMFCWIVAGNCFWTAQLIHAALRECLRVRWRR